MTEQLNPTGPLATIEPEQEQEEQGYPLAFIDSVWDTGFTTLTEWLAANAPQEVQDLHEALGILTAHMAGSAGEVDDSKGVAEALLQVTRGVQALGGSFYSPAGKINH